MSAWLSSSMMQSQREVVSPQPAYPAPLEPVPLLEAGDGVARMPNAPRTGLPPDDSSAPAAGGSGLTQAATIAIAMSITVAVLLLVFATAAFVMRQRRRRQRRGTAKEAAAFASHRSAGRSRGEAGRDVTAEDMPDMLSSEYSMEVWPRHLALHAQLSLFDDLLS